MVCASMRNALATTMRSISKASIYDMVSSIYDIVSSMRDRLLLAAFTVVLLAGMALFLLAMICRAVMEGMARSVHSRFWPAADEVVAEIRYGAVQHRWPDESCVSSSMSEAESMCALRLCVQEVEIIRNEDDDDDDGATCAVCLREMTRNRPDEVGQLVRCRHVFHRTCIQTWLRRCCRSPPATCPLCRAPLL